MKVLTTIWMMILISYSLSYYAEHRRHHINAEALKNKGANIAKTKWRTTLTLTKFVFIFATILEPLFLTSPAGRWHRLAGILILTVSCGFRWFSINSIGLPWTKDITFWRGQVFHKSGPYRYFRHPEYFSHLYEFIGICFVIGAPRVAVVGTAVLFLIIRRLIQFESRYHQQYHLTSA